MPEHTPLSWTRAAVRKLLLATATVSLATTAMTASAQDSAPPASCDGASFAALDFWLGDWNVVDQNGEEQGTNRIEKILGGCALIENWENIHGNEGKSLFYFDADFDGPGWRQVWVTEQAGARGGSYAKDMVDYDGPGVRFQGLTPGRGTTLIINRTTLSPLDDGTVRQHIEVSVDDGTTWRTTFDAIYMRRDADS